MMDEHVHKCEQARGVWGYAPLGKFLELGASEMAMFEPKYH